MKTIQTTLGFLLFVIFITGCGPKFPHEIDYRVYNISEDSNLTKKYDNNTTANKMDINSTIDIRLSNVYIHDVFDSKLFDTEYSRQTNEIGIFINIYEYNNIVHKDINSTEDLSKYKMIYYSGNSAVQNLNLSFLPIYKDKYRGGDMAINIKIIEFDSEESKNLNGFYNTISTLTQNSIGAANPTTIILKQIGDSLFKAYGKDDMIGEYEFHLLSAEINNDNNSYLPILKQGDYIIQRVSKKKNEYQINWNTNKYKKEVKKLQGTENSYIVLTIIER